MTPFLSELNCVWLVFESHLQSHDCVRTPEVFFLVQTLNRQPEDCEPDSVWVQNHRLGSESQTSLSIHGPTQKRQEHNGIFKPFTSDKQYDLGFHRQIYQYS